IVSLAFSPDCNLLAVGMARPAGSDPGGSLAIWDWRNERKLHDWPGSQGRIQSIRFDKIGSRIAAASSSDRAEEGIRVWNVVDGEFVNSIPGVGVRDASIVFLPSGRRLVETGGGALGGMLRVVDLESSTEQHRQVLRGSTGWVRSLVALDDGRLLTASWDG